MLAQVRLGLLASQISRLCSCATWRAARRGVREGEATSENRLSQLPRAVWCARFAALLEDVSRPAPGTGPIPNIRHPGLCRGNRSCRSCPETEASLPRASARDKVLQEEMVLETVPSVSTQACTVSRQPSRYFRLEGAVGGAEARGSRRVGERPTSPAMAGTCWTLFRKLPLLPAARSRGST